MLKIFSKNRLFPATLPILFAFCLGINIETVLKPDGKCSRTITIVYSKRPFRANPYEIFGIPEGSKWKTREEAKAGKYYYLATGAFSKPEEMEWKYSSSSLSKRKKFFFTYYEFREKFGKILPQATEEIDEQQTSDTQQEISDTSSWWQEFKEEIGKTGREIKDYFTKRHEQKLSEIPIEIKLVMPGKIVETNSDKLDGKIVLWKFSLLEAQNGYEIFALARNFNLFNLIL